MAVSSYKSCFVCKTEKAKITIRNRAIRSKVTSGATPWVAAPCQPCFSSFLGSYFCGASVQCIRFFRAIGRPVKFCHILKARAHIGVVRAEGLLRNSQRPPVEGLGLCLVALGAV